MAVTTQKGMADPEDGRPSRLLPTDRVGGRSSSGNSPPTSRPSAAAVRIPVTPRRRRPSTSPELPTLGTHLPVLASAGLQTGKLEPLRLSSAADAPAALLAFHPARHCRFSSKR